MTAFGWKLEIPDGFLVAGWRQRKSDGRGIKSQCSGTSERQVGREGFWCGRIAIFGNWHRECLDSAIDWIGILDNLMERYVGSR